MSAITPSILVARTLMRDAARACRRSSSAARFASALASDGSLPARRAPPSSCLGDRIRPSSTAVEFGDGGSKIPDASLQTSEESEDSPGQPRKISQVRISEVLKRKHAARWVQPVISKDATVREAIAVSIEGKLDGMMVVDRSRTMSKQNCEGLVTARDILRIMADSIRDGKSPDEILNERMGDHMTPIDQVIYARPDETIGQCRAIMAKLGIKCLPVLAGGRVEGILTLRDMSEFYFDATDKGGKKNYLRDVSGRLGLTADTSMAEQPVFLRQHLALRHAPLFLNVGVAESPHPFKTADGVGGSRRDHGHGEDLSTDPDLSEDAHFVSQVEQPDETGNNTQKVTYMGVADGVGGWREYGVDPREFSRRLMGECENILREDSARRSASGSEEKLGVISPLELLAQSYERTKAANVIGSSTACVALFDSVHHQLHFSNIGDSGIIVLRHIDSGVASALQRNRTTPRAERKSDLRVSFVSQQQLKSFNHPYQMGWTGEEIVEGTCSFKKASDSWSSSVQILRGDIIIMATDGLFDNVDIDDITEIALRWEQESGLIYGGGAEARKKRWASGNSLTDVSTRLIPELAETLCHEARRSSLDDAVDSPFALLAKENDIMWSGGMPDDCTVIAMHVIGEQPSAPSS